MDEFLGFVASIFEVDPSELSAETAYGSIPQWDSMMQLRLVGEIEDEYEVDIPLSDVSKVETLADLYAYIS